MSSARIVLADDHTWVRAGLRKLLESIPGVTVVGEAADGQDLIALVRDLQPDLVLLDIAMPGMNGLELARAIRQEALLPTIIFLSMHDIKELRAAAHELDVGFVSKSDFVTELMSLPKDLAQRHADPLPG